jgi:hypothetical protein
VPALPKRLSLPPSPVWLAQLKYPLVFFGLGLLVTEAAFGVVLVGNSTETTKLAAIGSMFFLFVFSIGVVAALVWKVPSHLMMTSERGDDSAAERIRKVRVAVALVESWKLNKSADPKELIEVLRRIEAEYE